MNFLLGEELSPEQQALLAAQPDPSQWSGPPPDYLAGLSASGSELNPQGLGPAFIPGFSTYGGVAPGTESWQGQWQPYDNAEVMQQVKADPLSADQYKVDFRDPRVDAWYAAHWNGQTGPDSVALMEQMLKDIPDAGVGSPLGRVRSLNDIADMQPGGMLDESTWYPGSSLPQAGMSNGIPIDNTGMPINRGPTLPHGSGNKWTWGGGDSPSTNNWRLLPSPYNVPGYILRNGFVIDTNSPSFTAGYPHGFMGVDLGGSNQNSPVTGVYSPHLGPMNGAPASFGIGGLHWGWPGALWGWGSYPFYLT